MSGRPATGRTTRVVRVPLDMDLELAVTAYYEFIPILQKYASSAKDSPRYDKLNSLLSDLIAAGLPVRGSRKT